jgi:hypothetical protein
VTRPVLLLGLAMSDCIDSSQSHIAALEAERDLLREQLDAADEDLDALERRYELDRAECGRLREQLDAARKIADAAEPGVSIPPADCTNNCGLGPCDCSGVYRVTAWAIDVPALRAALGVEGEQEKR